LLVRQRVAGSCWTTSAVVGRAYSWRCLHRNEIHDPCFSATRHSSIVVCPVRPWSRTVLVIRLTSALPGWKEYGFDQNFPWGVWTTNHKRCFSYSGSATGGVAGRAVTYGCEGGGLLVGLADRRTRQWTIHYVAGWHSTTAVVVGITDAWT
jgi:hypothetical protein